MTPEQKDEIPCGEQVSRSSSAQTVKTKTAAMDLTQGPVFKTLVLFSLPFLLSTFLQTMYNTVDMMIVVNVVGKEGLSALSTGSLLMELVMVLCMGFSGAGQVLIAQSIGAGNREKAKTVTNTLLTLMLILSTAIFLIALFGCDTFLGWLNTPAESFAYAHSYVRICSFGILFTGIYNTASAMFRGIGDSKHPLYVVAVSSILNIILDCLFVIGFGWGAGGAALATVISQGVSVIFVLVVMYRRQDLYLLEFRKESLRIDRKMALQITKLGIPMGLQGATICISFLFVSGLFNSMGVVVSAVFGACNKIRNFPNMVNQAANMGTTAMMGQCIGAGKMDRVDKAYKSCLAIMIVSCSFFGVLYFLFPETFFGFFTDDTEVLSYASMCITCILLEFPAKIFMPNGNALVNASGFVKLSMPLAFIDAIVGRIFLTWFMGNILGLGVLGYFLGYCGATYITAIPLLIYYLSGKWKTRAKLV